MPVSFSSICSTMPGLDSKKVVLTAEMALMCALAHFFYFPLYVNIKMLKYTSWKAKMPKNDIKYVENEK